MPHVAQGKVKAIQEFATCSAHLFRLQSPHAQTPRSASRSHSMLRHQVLQPAVSVCTGIQFYSL